MPVCVKLCASVHKKLGTVSCFNPANLQWSINSPKKDTSYNGRFCLVFVPHQSAPYYQRLVSSVKALDGLRLFIKQVKTGNLVRSRTVDVPCFFHALELARRCSHGSVVEENADSPWCTAKLSLKLWKIERETNFLLLMLSKLFFYKTYGFY